MAEHSLLEHPLSHLSGLSQVMGVSMTLGEALPIFGTGIDSCAWTSTLSGVSVITMSLSAVDPTVSGLSEGIDIDVILKAQA